MKVEIKESQLKWIASKSLINCHTIGVDSVLFDDSPGKRIRAFIANKNHDLYKNFGAGKLSVALHPHHCNIVLKPIFGEVWNITAVGSVHGKRYDAFKYESQITTSTGRFVRGKKEDALVVNLRSEVLNKQQKMSASDVHTVGVPYGRPAAWWVYEGAEDSTYDGACWSNADLERFDFAPLYRPMSTDYLVAVLGAIGIRIKKEEV